MLTPTQVSLIIKWFENTNKAVIHKEDIDVLKVIVEVLRDAEGSRGEGYKTFKEFYTLLIESEIPRWEKIYNDESL